MNRSSAVLSALFASALALSVLAGWGLVSSSSTLAASASRESATTTVGYSTSSPALSSSTVTTVQTVTTSTATNSVSSTTVGPAQTTTATTTSAGQTVTTTIAASTTTTVASATVVAGTTASFGAASQGGGLYSSLSGLSAQTRGEALLREVQSASLLLAPVCWVLVGGAWVWRGRVRARYSELGFGSDVFELFMKMKGGATRVKVLNTLSTPKDRLQLAQELGVDWKTVDRHVQILNKYGFVKEQASYGTVRLYEVTPTGRMLLNLFEDLDMSGPVQQVSGVADSRPDV